MFILKKYTGVVIVIVLAILIMSVSGFAVESNYPTRPISFVVPASPGGGTDASARILAKYLTQELGQAVVIVNVTGGGGGVGSREVKDSNPDGYTALYYHENTIMTNVIGLTEYGYEAFEVCAIPLIVDSLGLVAGGKYKSLKEVISIAKENPEKLIYGTELGGSFTIPFFAIQNLAGVKFNLVDTGSIGPTIAVMVGGQIDLTATPLGMVKDYLETGQITALATMGEERSPLLPDIPTLIEQGIDFSYPKFYCIAFPKETSEEIVQKFSDAVKKVVENPAYQEEVKKLFFTPHYLNSEEAIVLIGKTKLMFEKYKDEMTKTTK